MRREQKERFLPSDWEFPGVAQFISVSICKTFFSCYLVQGVLIFRVYQYIVESTQHYLSSLSAEETQGNSSKDFEGNGKDKRKICSRQVYLYLLDFPLKNSDY